MKHGSADNHKFIIDGHILVISLVFLSLIINTSYSSFSWDRHSGRYPILNRSFIFSGCSIGTYHSLFVSGCFGYETSWFCQSYFDWLLLTCLLICLLIYQQPIDAALVQVLHPCLRYVSGSIPNIISQTNGGTSRQRALSTASSRSNDYQLTMITAHDAVWAEFATPMLHPLAHGRLLMLVLGTPDHYQLHPLLMVLPWLHNSRMDIIQ